MQNTMQMLDLSLSTVFLQRGWSPPIALSTPDQSLPRLASWLLSYSFPYTQCCPWGLAL